MFEKELKKMLSKKRLIHSYNVAYEARKLAVLYGADPSKAEIAGLLHDITKELNQEQHLQIIADSDIILDDIQTSMPKLLHAISGYLYSKNVLNIKDQEILAAIRFHTTAKADMSLLEKIVYISDYISKDRTFDDVDFMRKLVAISIEDTLSYALTYTIKDLVLNKYKIHPDTFLAYNFYV